MRVFPRRLVECRRLAGKTQAELAAEIGVSRDTLRRWEQGKSFPDINVGANLVLSLNTSMAYLIGLTNRRHRVVVTDEEDRLITVYRKLSKGMREALLETAKDALALEQREQLSGGCGSIDQSQ